eukprot:CAMPEP_0194298960 /NCGR_PEP_ID=MMETSP0169-20130528/60450_1 /TAXON_ID=218684 /ORGANISM="Corethron pennatum, Strain L29A3" /LENGTH=547 /DNA_ID=CAMNT_0039049013 /DNA_START=463 /DNA_END=2107 /DNA_ORIENTATION=+
MYFSKVLLTTIAALAGASAAKFPVTNGVTKNTANNKFKSKLLSKAKPLKRKLDEGDDAADEEIAIDLTGYSIVFEKCQYVKFYNVGDEDGQNDEEGGSVLSVNKFVIFKLCNSNYCSSGCNSDYAEYVIDMETYVAALIEMKQESVENYCGQCQENCQQDDDAAAYEGDCADCMEECDAYDALEENGYGDASEYTECQDAGNDDDANAYYTGAYCSDDGSKISIGVFSDEYCSSLVSGKSAAKMLGVTALSTHILSATYSSDCISCLKEQEEAQDEDDQAESKISIGVFSDEYCSSLISGQDAAETLGVTALSTHILGATYSSDCISCLKEQEEAQDEDDQAEEQEAETSETCQALYDSAGKCESPTGFQGGYLEYYSSQASNEDDICNFISSLDSGTYDQTGEIVIGEGGVKTVSGGSTATGGQKFFLTVLILSTAGLAGYAAMLHQKITGGSADGLSKQGGAMAKPHFNILLSQLKMLYDQTGEIVIGEGGVKTVGGGSMATGGQKFFLTVLILSTIGLAGYAAMLHQTITAGADGLSKQGGALA